MTEARKTARRENGSSRPTLIDVAHSAGVSVMTVSNYVRGKVLREPTRKRVEDAIARLNYRPNLSARSLRLAHEQSVGIVIADSDPAFLNDPFISRLVSGLSNYLSSLDYTLDVQGIAPERFTDATILKKFGNAALCAILCGSRSLRRQQVVDLQKLRQPVVILQETFPSPATNVAIVSQDDQSGGRQLAQHLRARRLRSVVFIRPALEWCAVEQREKGLRSELEGDGGKIEMQTLTSESEGFQDVQRLVGDYLAKHPAPGAFVAATDSMAAAVLKACELVGVRIPEEVKIAGFNGFDVWQYTTPALTTVVSPAYEMGREAGALIIEKLRTGEFPKRNVVLPVRLQIGGSTN